ncbi:MAG: DoxX family protein [Leucobacter sp.]|nr:DoxX family protein [Leucobacter sp.]
MFVLTITTWALSGVLALMFLMAGGMKLAKPLADMPMATLQALTPTQVNLIGAAEVLGAVAVIAAPLTGVFPVLAPIAAIGLAIIQFLAIFAHKRFDEPFGKNIVLMALALAVAALWFVIL